MTTQIILTLAIIVAAMVLFAWNRVPAAVVAACASLALFFTGVLTMQEVMSVPILTRFLHTETRTR